MKKLIILSALVCFCAAGLHAMSITNPVYMPKEGGLMSETGYDYRNSISGQSFQQYTLTETLSYNLTNRLQLGGYIGYQKVSSADFNQRDFTNPGVFGYFRILDNMVKLDAGASIEFNAFDDSNEGGVSDGANKYSVLARLGVDLGALSVGAMGKLGYWEGSGVKMFTKDEKDNTKYGELNAFAIFDVLDIVGIGGEIGFRSFDLTKNTFTDEYYLTARVDINPIPEKLGIVAYYTFTDPKNNDTDYALGLKLKLVI